MSTTPPEIPVKPEFDERTDRFISDWKRVRELIQHEDNLVNHRTQWLAAINAFLLTGYFVSQSAVSIDADLKLFSKFGIPLIGLIVSFAVKIALSAAMLQQREIVTWWGRRKAHDPSNLPESPDDSKNLRHPQIVGLTSRGGWSHDFMIVDVLPSTVISVWVFMFLGASMQALKGMQSFTLPVWGWVTLIVGIAAVSPMWLQIVGRTIKSKRSTER
jgi:hypothetical protein